jgi:periplasmic protein CpxP/Spy
MTLTQDQRGTIDSELKRFSTDLNLTDEQKQKLHGFLTDASEKVHEYKQLNPSASKDDMVKKVKTNRAGIRARLTHFLNPAQLAKWDAEVAKAKEFLGQKIAA